MTCQNRAVPIALPLYLQGRESRPGGKIRIVCELKKKRWCLGNDERKMEHKNYDITYDI